MNFEYSKTREQKKEIIKKNIEKQHNFIKDQNLNQFIVNSNLGMNNLYLNKNLKSINEDNNLHQQNIPNEVKVEQGNFNVMTKLTALDNQNFNLIKNSNVIKPQNNNLIKDLMKNKSNIESKRKTSREIIRESNRESNRAPIHETDRVQIRKSNRKSNREPIRESHEEPNRNNIRKSSRESFRETIIEPIPESKRISRRETKIESKIESKINIINIYQNNYINGKVTGFGDFLRGCYYLMQFCDENNYNYKIDLSKHILSNFLKNKINFERENKYINKFEDINAQFIIQNNNNIETKIKNNFKLFKDYIEKQEIYNNKIYVYTISYPIFYPSPEHKKYIKFILEPTNEILQFSNKILEKINLLNKKYIVVHIRFGDEYLIDKEKNFNVLILNKLKNEIDQLTKGLKESNNYLLLADNNSIKKYIVDIFPFFKTFFKEITHIGEGSKDLDKIKNTMVEFHLMSYAKSIHSYSCYLHGSGFSKWCARTYDIPYTNKFIG